MHASARLRDVLGAVLLGVFGAWICFVGWSYGMGSATDMGSGYFPVLLGGFLVAIAVLILGTALMPRPAGANDPFQPEDDPGEARPLVAVLAAVVAFGFLMESLGLGPAIVAAVFVARLAAPPFRPLETACLAAILAILCVFVFIWVLGLPLEAF